MLPFSLNVKQRLLTYDHPLVMAIVNVTPDSFYASSRSTDEATIKQRVTEAINQGADIIDLGAYSSRPGAMDVDIKTELERLETGMKIIRQVSSDIPVSIDTFRAQVARTAITQLGADIINDISGGNLDNKMFETVASLGCPYILMHMRGTPRDMMSDDNTSYNDVTAEVLSSLAIKVGQLSLMGVKDIIIDPGFGFAKTLDQNYTLMNNLEVFTSLGRPILVGISRKSMLTHLLNISANDALNATTALNAMALDRGASILRVHDVLQARQCVDIHSRLNPNHQ